jgi:hypothetical protein
MTTTRSAISATTPMSWVMKRTAMPTSRCSSLMSERICAWMVTSRAVVGSSAIRRSGWQASAMAIMTRWRMPPEKVCGNSLKRRLASGMRTRSKMRSASALAARSSMSRW